jgi:Ca2+-binding EF-hand superfamily protein
MTAFAFEPKTRESFQKIFELFDDENIGFISAKNLRRIAK